MKFATLIIFSFLLSFSSCKVRNLTKNFEAPICSQHNVTHKKRLQHCKPMICHAEYLIEYDLIYSCPACYKEIWESIKKQDSLNKVLIKAERIYFKHDSLIISCTKFLENKEYVENTKVGQTYKINEKNVYSISNFYYAYPDTLSNTLTLLDSILENGYIYIKKNKYIKNNFSDTDFLKTRVKTQKELKEQKIKYYIEFKKIWISPLKWRDNFANIDIILQPINYPIMNQLVLKDSTLKIRRYTFYK